MDERYQQQPGSGPTQLPQQPGAYPPHMQQSPYPMMTPAVPPAQRGVFRRVVRLLLRRSLYVGARTGRVFQPFRLTLMITLPLLALLAILSTALMWDRIVGPPPVFARAESLPPAPDVENFLEGQRSYDGGKMWDALSPDFQSQLVTNGMSRQSLRQQLQEQKSSGPSYLQPLYVGGVPVKSGGAMYFYQMDATGQQGISSTAMVFTVDAKGKIVGIKSN